MNKRTQRGLTMIELVFVIAVSIVVAGFAVPKCLTMQQSFRIAGDSRSIAGLVAEAKLRGPANFTHARVYADLNANTYRLEVWNKSGGVGGCWQTDGDSAPCTVTGVSPVQNLSTGVTFGVGAVQAPPPNTQAVLAQAPACYNGYAGMASNSVQTGNNACIEFNSRGVPVDSTGLPTPNGAFYVTDGTSVHGNTLLASGLIQSWYAPNTSTATWQQR